MDRKLEYHLDKAGGFFIEPSANDGFSQSNTYYFERCRGWTGVLREPIPELFQRCRRLRKRFKVLNAALVNPEFEADTMEIAFAGLMSTVDMVFPDVSSANQHVADSIALQGLKSSYRARVPARTLSSILDELHVHVPIDLLTLDVEGHESSVLRGLDLERYQAAFICVEVRVGSDVDDVLRPYYEIVDILQENAVYRDILYRRTQRSGG